MSFICGILATRGCVDGGGGRRGKIRYARIYYMDMIFGLALLSYTVQ